MTKWLQDLNLLHRIVAVIHFLQGLFMIFGGKFIAEQYGWDYSIDLQLWWSIMGQLLYV